MGDVLWTSFSVRVLVMSLQSIWAITYSFSIFPKRICAMSLMCCTEPPLPGSAIMPASVSNEVDGGDFGFRIEWNEPELLLNDAFLTGYRVFVEDPRPAGRRKRQQRMPTATTGRDETTYTFRNGIAFTDYTVSVEGVLSVNGEEATVTALAPYMVTTEAGGESFVSNSHPSLLSFPPPSQYLILLKSSVLKM